MHEKLVLKKNPCPDCSFCQCCSDTRCAMCRKTSCDSKKDAMRKGKPHKPLFRAY
jgi:hypothetical protein